MNNKPYVNSEIKPGEILGLFFFGCAFFLIMMVMTAFYLMKG